MIIFRRRAHKAIHNPIRELDFGPHLRQLDDIAFKMNVTMDERSAAYFGRWGLTKKILCELLLS